MVARSARWAAVAGTELIPLNVAEMDFPTDPVVVERIQRLLLGPLTYSPPYTDNDIAGAVVDHYRREHGLAVPRRNVQLAAGIVAQSYHVMRELLAPSDAGLYFGPAYHSIPDSITAAGARAVAVHLDPWTTPAWDVAELERRIVPGTRLIHLSHPHNPTGHQFGLDELRAIADVAERHDLLIVSNEVYARLTLQGRHLPMAAIAPRRTLTITGATKSHNLAGIGGSVMFSHDSELMARLRSGTRFSLAAGRSIQQAALAAAYEQDSPWLRATRDRLRANQHRIAAELRRCRAVDVHVPVATYFLWLRVGELPEQADAAQVLRDGCGLVGAPGAEFGASRDFVRLAVAMTPEDVDMVVARIRAWSRYEVSVDRAAPVLPARLGARREPFPARCTGKDVT